MNVQIRSAMSIAIPANFKNAHNSKRVRVGKTRAENNHGTARNRFSNRAVRVSWQNEKSNKMDMEFASVCKGNGNSSARRPERVVKQLNPNRKSLWYKATH